MSKACLKEEEFFKSDVDLVFEDMTVMTDFELHSFCEKYPTSMSQFALEDEEWMDSGKVTKLCELLIKFKADGDRVLVFSQFTMVMNILEAVMETLGMRFFRLDGQTKIDERQDMIDQFYEEEDITVFLLSTKAGGAGINLACANKVIIFDSSFNPQEDIQAENRAHRVGQKREVEVIRLVTRGTIEEQIHALGETKLALTIAWLGWALLARRTRRRRKRRVRRWWRR
jgi:SWI/SNF-related matrix-associated actin-dependent regulator 1 of chromatin subfamily A